MKNQRKNVITIFATNIRGEYRFETSKSLVDGLNDRVGFLMGDYCSPIRLLTAAIESTDGVIRVALDDRVVTVVLMSDTGYDNVRDRLIGILVRHLGWTRSSYTVVDQTIASSEIDARAGYLRQYLSHGETAQGPIPGTGIWPDGSLHDKRLDMSPGDLYNPQSKAIESVLNPEERNNRPFDFDPPIEESLGFGRGRPDRRHIDPRD